MNYEKLKALLTEVEELNRTSNFENAEQRANEILTDLDNLEKTVDKEALDELNALRCCVLIELSASQWRRGNFQSALTHALSSIDLVDKLTNPKLKAKALGNIGSAYSNLSDYPRALTYYQKALTINEEIGHKAGMAANLGNIGIVYQFLSDYAHALTYYQKALAVNEEIQSKIGMVGNLANIGIVYRYLLDYPQALTYHQKALAINEEREDKDGIAKNLGNIGVVHEYLSDYPQAFTYYLKALAINEEIGNKASILRNLGNIGGIYAKKEFDGYSLDAAEENLLRAISICIEISEKRNQYEFYQSLAAIYERQERWPEFAFHFKKFHSLKEEVQSEEATKQAQQMENRRKVEESERDRQVKLARFQEQEKILLNILPSKIAERILEGEKLIADMHEEVTIFFSDIVGFTDLSQNISPEELLALLNEIFTAFDKLTHKHGLEKIKTIGDAYMAVAGVPLAQIDHAERAASFALDAIEYMKSYQKKSGTNLQIRIGLHCGRAIAGVIGENKFVFDLWGDSVNTASRMESHGEPGKIHVSDVFRNALTKTNLHFIDRGEMVVKGKGIMKTYFLESN
jgi:class 3 adenylate cyclase